VAGTDFTFDDLFSFPDIVPQNGVPRQPRADRADEQPGEGYPLDREHNWARPVVADDVWICARRS
jgi:hypothetical protein